MIPQKTLLIAAFLLALPVAAQTENSMGGYASMEIEAGSMKGNFATGAIEEMTGGVRIRLLSDEPGLEPLPIEAGTMKFTWAEGRATPATIIMETKVKVKHPDAEISAGRAEWNFDTGELIFSGDPVVNSERLKGLRGERMVLNLKTNTFEVTQVRADQVPLHGAGGAPGAPSNPNEIRAGDITDWTGLIDAIKAEATSEDPCPGRQILKQMSTQNQQLLLQMNTSQLVERKEDILRLFNSILGASSFYTPEAWADSDLSEELQQLTAAEDLDKAGQAKMNRLLIEAAYPFAFAKP
ncbi:MAG: hypothetical protein GXY07_19035 [Candidatus Hydrogenedentes bacterium]|nr:hypothetical protein [Candidatus Hydrogenedentota bacterium]